MPAHPSSIQSLLNRAFNPEGLEKSRRPWVDYLKGIAILLVVYRHVLIGLERNGFSIPKVYTDANMAFFSFRMPLFFLLSGLFIGASLAKRSVKQLIALKAETILYPYLVWVLIQIGLQIVLGGASNANRSWIDFTYIFYQPRSLDQFWYLPALFNCTVIFIILKTKFLTPVWLQLALGSLFYFTAHYFDTISLMSDWMECYLFFAIGDAVSGFFFGDRSQAWMNNRLGVLYLLPLFVVSQFYFLNFPTNLLEFLLISLIGCLYMFLLSFRLERWSILIPLRILGFHSLQIYVMHVICSAFLRTILTKGFGIDNPIVLLFSGIIFGVAAPVAVYNLLIKNNIGWFLFSFRHPASIQGRKRSDTATQLQS